MHRKLTLTILAAASLSAIALAPTAASARHFGGGGGWGGNFHHDHFDHFDHHFGFVGGGYDNGCFVTRSVPTPFGYRLRTINVCGY